MPEDFNVILGESSGAFLNDTVPVQLPRPWRHRGDVRDELHRLAEETRSC